MAFRGAIFDLDGTVLDSMAVWGHVLPNFLRDRGLELKPGLMERVGSMTFAQSSQYVKELYALSDSPEAIQMAWSEEARRQYAEEVPEKAGAGDFIRKLKVSGIRLSAATACMRPLAEAALDRLGLRSFLEPIFYADELGMDKRNPRLYECCAEAMEILPCECVVFEDSFQTLAAVREAGMKFVGVFDARSAADAVKLRQEGDLFVIHWDGLTVEEIACLFS
jgi:HAD superfamily hydrolase (TIGR01509 family)